MAARAKHCNSCGEKIRPEDQTRFETGDRVAIYHALCFWGVAARSGLSYLKQASPSYDTPFGLILPCSVCDSDIYTYEEPVWYERVKSPDGYRPYHPKCSPSYLVD